MALLPLGVATVTSTVPAPAGASARTWVDDCTTNHVELALPNFTELALEKFVPLMMTRLFPEVGPLVGLRPLTTGAPGAA